MRNRSSLPTFVRRAATGMLGRALTLTALLAFTVLSLLGGSVTLCIEQGGTFSIEPSGAACCDDDGSGTGTAPRSSPSSVRTAQGDADCIDCVDTSLWFDLRDGGTRVGPDVLRELAELNASFPRELTSEIAPLADARAAKSRAWSLLDPPGSAIRCSVLRC